LQQAKAHD
ncbi:hypothetical protein CP061683_0752B, partial [Chlamydia psittaci 06-1683]